MQDAKHIKKHWLIPIIVLGCLLIIATFTLSTLQRTPTQAANGGEQQTDDKSNTTSELYLQQTTNSATTIQLTAYSLNNGSIAWTTSQQYDHLQYLKRSNGINHISHENTTYFISKCQLYAVKTDTGKLLWQRDLLEANQTFCSYYNILLDAKLGHIYLVGTVSSDPIEEYPMPDGEMPMRSLPVNSQPRLLAIKMQTGKIAWQNTSIGGSTTFGAFLAVSPFVADSGSIYTTKAAFAQSAEDNRLVAIDGQTGRIRWQDQRSNEEVQSIVATNGVAYILSAQLNPDRQTFNHFTLAALASDNGTPLWTQQWQTDRSSELVVHEKQLIAQSLVSAGDDGTYHVQLHRLDPKTGKAVSSLDLGVAEQPTALVTDKHLLYVLLGGTELRAIQLATNKVSWHATLEGSGRLLTLSNNQLVLFYRTATKETFLISLDVHTGTTLWKQSLL